MKLGNVAPAGAMHSRRGKRIAERGERRSSIAALLSVIDEHIGISNMRDMHTVFQSGEAARAGALSAEFPRTHAGEDVPRYPCFRLYRRAGGGQWKCVLERL